MEREPDLQDADAADIYKVDILTAMTAFRRIWSELEVHVIENYWRHSGILGDEGDALRKIKKADEV